MVKWLTRSYEIKMALRATLSKLLESETSFSDFESREKKAGQKTKLFDLKTVTKFAGIRADLSKHPLDWIFQKIQTNFKSEVYSAYLNKLKSPRKLKSNFVLDDTVSLTV